MRSIYAAFVAGVLAMVAIAFPTETEAKCAGHSVRTWPEPGETLPANRPRIVVTGYRNARPVIRNLAEDPPALVSDDETVALEHVETLQSSEGLAQVVLRATEHLTTGNTYELDDDRLTLHGSRARLLPAGGGENRLEWTAGSPDRDAPELDGRPEQTGATYQPLGCGPASYVEIAPSVVGDASDDVIYRGRLEPAEGSGAAQEFWVAPDADGSVSIGHGMCGGPFDLEEGGSYLLRLQAMDGAGNRSAYSEPIEVTGPGGD